MENDGAGGKSLLALIASRLAAHGLRPRGVLLFGAGDAVPPALPGKLARTVVLVGHAGGEMWPHFTRWKRDQPAGMANPLDAWSKLVIGAIAAEFDARAVFPSDPPFLPFQQWAMRAEGLKPSPLGLLIHPEFGLWHAFRGALLLDVSIQVEPEKLSHACDACSEKPCLSACPVSAFSSGGFAVVACRAHVQSGAGQTCRETGCMARNACPAGADYRYTAEQQAFHQGAFMGGL